MDRVGSRYAMLDWQRELNQIIKQTERNLHGRTETYPVPLGRSFGGLGASRGYGGGLSGGYGGGQENAAPPAEHFGASSSAGAALGGGGPSAGPGASLSGMSEQKLAELLQQINGGTGASPQREAEELRSQQSAFKEAFSRVLDGIKFELDMRQNLSAKQLEAMREEVNIALASNERRALDASRELDVTLQAKLAAEKEMRMSSEMHLEGLRQNVAQAQQDINRSLGELQDMVIAQREATHTLEKELLSYKLETESKLTDDAKRIAQLDRVVHAVGGQLEPHAVESERGGASSVSHRLREVELALLNERELRKMVEAEVHSLRHRRDEVHEELDAKLAVLRGGGLSDEAAHAGRQGDYRVLDEKVKECAKLIVRMGSELMEETRRRQRLEEELSELRTRLTTMESVHSSSMAASYRVGARSPPAQSYGYSAGRYDGGYGSPPQHQQPFAVHSVAPSPPQTHSASYAQPYAQSYAQPYAQPASAAPPAAPSAAAVAAQMLSAPPPGGEGAEAATWSDETQAAVASQLDRRGVSDAPSSSPGGGRRSSVSSNAVDERVRSILSRSNPSLPTVSNRSMTRDELDARVQEILGRHSGGGGT